MAAGGGGGGARGRRARGRGAFARVRAAGGGGGLQGNAYAADRAAAAPAGPAPGWEGYGEDYTAVRRNLALELVRATEVSGGVPPAQCLSPCSSSPLPPPSPSLSPPFLHPLVSQGLLVSDEISLGWEILHPLPRGDSAGCGAGFVEVVRPRRRGHGRLIGCPGYAARDQCLRARGNRGVLDPRGPAFPLWGATVRHGGECGGGQRGGRHEGGGGPPRWAQPHRFGA